MEAWGLFVAETAPAPQPVRAHNAQIADRFGKRSSPDGLAWLMERD